MIGGIVTALAMLGFISVVVWVYMIRRREDYDEPARMPLEDEQPGDPDQDRESN
ncbi:MAG: hypothetical protein Kow0020_08610 [Wenzhouxiangellaceae bacterium]